MVLRFNEVVGTPGADGFTTQDGSIYFGLAGADSFTSSPGQEFQIAIGGADGDSYTVVDNSALTIWDLGKSDGDRLVVDGIGFSRDGSYAATIEGRHLVAADVDSGQVVFLLDWLSADSQIETVVTAEGAFSPQQINDRLSGEEGFLGDVRWEDLSEVGLASVDSAEVNEALTFYLGRLQELEGTRELDEPIENAVYRFFNPASGAHFYTNGTLERQAVFEARQLNYEGPVFRAAEAADPEATSVWRFFNTETGTHFYTISDSERDSIQATLPQFQFENEAYKAYENPIDDAVPLYRFFNTETGTHFYTVSEAERDNIIVTLPQFAFEDVAYYVEAL